MQVFMNRSSCLGLSMIEISNIIIYEFLYDYIKPQYNNKAKDENKKKLSAYRKINWVLKTLKNL